MRSPISIFSRLNEPHWRLGVSSADPDLAPSLLEALAGHGDLAERVTCGMSVGTGDGRQIGMWWRWLHRLAHFAEAARNARRIERDRELIWAI